MIIFIREKDDYMVQLECHIVTLRDGYLEVFLSNGRLSVYPINDIFGFQITGKDE